MNVLSLFAGIGGLDLGLEWAGMRVVGQVELDPYCRAVLDKHWPEVPKHDDVRTCVDWWRSEPRPDVDLVAGGFPCQPVSTAGSKRAQADERWLWPEMATVIEALRPTWVVWENVPGLLTRGLDLVHADLVRLGYRHRVGWTSACALGAPHPRRRLFGVSHTDGLGRSPGRDESGNGTAPAEPRPWHQAVRHPGWAIEPALDRVAYGISGGLDRRVSLGNAVAPPVARYIGELIMHAEGAAHG